MWRPSPRALRYSRGQEAARCCTRRSPPSGTHVACPGWWWRSRRSLTGNRLLLKSLQLRDANAGERDHCCHLSVIEGGFLARRLYFDELTAASHHDVHVDIGSGVLFVIEVQQGLTFDDADADGRHGVQHG